MSSWRKRGPITPGRSCGAALREQAYRATQSGGNGSWIGARVARLSRTTMMDSSAQLGTFEQIAPARAGASFALHAALVQRLEPVVDILTNLVLGLAVSLLE